MLPLCKLRGTCAHSSFSFILRSIFPSVSFSHLLFQILSLKIFPSLLYPAQEKLTVISLPSSVSYPSITVKSRVVCLFPPFPYFDSLLIPLSSSPPDSELLVRSWMASYVPHPVEKCISVLIILDFPLSLMQRWSIFLKCNFLDSFVPLSSHLTNIYWAPGICQELEILYSEQAGKTLSLPHRAYSLEVFIFFYQVGQTK